MSALTNKMTLAPGETVGLLDLTGATPGTLYAIQIRTSGMGIVSSPDSVESYPIDNQRTYITDTEILVKNVSGVRRSIQAVALAKGTGGSTGTTAVGEVIVPPGATVGLLAVAGATPGNLYSVTALGDRVGMVSEESGAVSFELENQRVYITKEEILVRNLTDTSDRISVLAIPAFEASGGAGGGAVSSVNGQVGEVSLSLNQLDDEGMAMTVTPIAVVDDMMAPARYISLVPAQGIGAMYSGENGTVSGVLGPSSLTLSDSNQGSAMLVAPESGDYSEVVLPSSPGTLVVAPPVPTTGTYTLQVSDGVASWVAV